METTATVNNGQWRHIAVTVDRDDPNGLKIYIDGSFNKKADPTSEGSLHHSDDFILGGNWAWDGNDHVITGTYTGCLDDVRFYKDTVLSASDIEDIYNNGNGVSLTGLETGLTWGSNCDSGYGPVVYDITETQNGTINDTNHVSWMDTGKIEKIITTDLDGDNFVDYNDLALFCNDWLWEPAWLTDSWMESMAAGGIGFGGLESMSLASFSLELETLPSSPADDLMLSTAAESLEAMPESLAAKVQKFYDITPAATVSAAQQQIDAEEMLEWLADIWLSGELDETITEAEWYEFVEDVKKALDY